MAKYLQHVEVREDSAQKLISNHAIYLNHLQCEFLGSKLHVAVEQAKKFFETNTWSSEAFTPESLLRHFYWQVEGAVTLVEKFCETTWLEVAAVDALARESFTLACLELEWFTALFNNFISQSGSTFDGISELERHETVKRVAALAFQDAEIMSVKLVGVIENGSLSEQTLAKTLLQKLHHDLETAGNTPHPNFSTLDARELVLGKSIGRGSSGIIYTTTWMNATYAMKAFFNGYQAIFEQEVAILARLNHPHVLPMIGSSIDTRGNCMLVVELMDEGLDTFIARNTRMSPLPLDEALDLMLQIGEGGKYLHHQGIVHRDLKPSNVLVKVGSFERERSVRVKVADFGISRTKERSSTCSPLTLRVGTIRWMAPEILGAASETSSGFDPVTTLSYPFKVDIYSYILICYEVLTGREPYADLSSLKEIKRKVKDENLRPTLPPSCPLGLAILFEKCWDADPRARPSFDDICNDLRHIKGHLLSGHSSVTLKPMSEVLNPGIPNSNHILSMNAGRTYNKFTMLKNNKIVDLVTHRELTSKEILRRVDCKRFIVNAHRLRTPYRITDFWPSSNRPTIHVATLSLATTLLSSWNSTIKQKMRCPHARFDLNITGEPTEDEIWDMIILAANQNFQGEKKAIPPQVTPHCKETVDDVETFLELWYQNCM